MSTIILILSVALLIFYLQATCQRVLHRQFAQPYFKTIVRAYCLESLSILEGADVSGQVCACDRLEADFFTLRYLLGPKLNHHYSLSERLLLLYFRLSISTLSLRQRFGLDKAAACGRLAGVVQYFANVAGEQMPSLVAAE